jgi:hypothetical protein
MDRTVAEALYVACEKTIASLTDAEHAIHQISDDEERKRLLRALSEVITDVLMNIRFPVVHQYPELEPPPVLGQPDTELCEEEQEVVSRLRPAEVALIDEALLTECASSWRKVARVVGGALGTLQDQLPGVPDGYYAQRIAVLVSAGNLESQGNLQHMRFSEVRLPGAVRSAA